MKNKVVGFGCFCILLVCLTGCSSSLSQSRSPAYWPTNGWKTSTPEEQGMDSVKLAQMAEQIQKDHLNIHSLLVIRNGYLVDELYLYPYSAEQAHWVMSVTKSVMSTLFGIAIQQGYIRDVHQPVSELLPPQDVTNLDDKKKALTLNEFLTMTSGLDCHETPAPDEPYMQASDNWVQFILNLPVIAKPGMEFNYCTGTIEVLSAILQNTTGMTTRDFANKNLFTPLGIGPIDESRWPSDPQGLTIGGYGLSLTPQEMAKMGLLFLNNGKWEGKQIVPESWVAASTTSHAKTGGAKDYGYLWWVDPLGKWYAALGRGGQHVFVYPAQNLVVVTTADLPASQDADLAPIQGLINTYILPSIKSQKPLPANPEGVSSLKVGMEMLSKAPRITPPRLPEIATAISGKKYTLEDNPLGWPNISLSFKEGAGEASVTVNGQTMQIGMDNTYRIVGSGTTPFPEGIRGHWESKDTFVVEVPTFGQPGRQIFRIQFLNDTIQITMEDGRSGNTVEINGRLAPNS
jgi:CubicO group peptidase (beta-lactamase class C family)